MNNYQQKIFNNFHETGLAQSMTWQDEAKHIKNIMATYDWNYKNLLPADKKAAILDLGCGLGECLSWLEQQGFKDVLGVDVSRQMLELAKKNTGAKLKKIDSGRDFLNTVKEGYDLIFMNDVIEHLGKQEIMDTLEVCRQALKKGGRLIIKTNNLASITGARMRYSDFTHEVGLTEYSLKQILMASGFVEIEIKPFALPITGLTRLGRYFLLKLCHACWKFKFWLNFTTVPEIVDEMIFAVGTK